MLFVSVLYIYCVVQWGTSCFPFVLLKVCCIRCIHCICYVQVAAVKSHLFGYKQLCEINSLRYIIHFIYKVFLEIAPILRTRRAFACHAALYSPRSGVVG